MIEEFPAPQEKQTSKIEGEVFVKDEWFKAYYRGNALIPQHGLGIGLCVLIECMKDKNMDWRNFDISKFSPEQVKYLGDAMSAMHKAKGINISTEERASTFIDRPIIVPSERMQDLWDATKDQVKRSLIRFIRRSDEETLDVGIISLFFTDSSNKKRIEDLEKCLRIIDAAFTDQQILELLSRYRNGFRPEGDKARWDDANMTPNYQEQFEELIAKKIKADFGDKFPREISYLFNE